MRGCATLYEPFSSWLMNLRLLTIGAGARLKLIRKHQQVYIMRRKRLLPMVYVARGTKFVTFLAEQLVTNARLLLHCRFHEPYCWQ